MNRPGRSTRRRRPVDPRRGFDETRWWDHPQGAEIYEELLDERAHLIGREVAAIADDGTAQPARVVGVAVRFLQVKFADGTRRLLPNQQVAQTSPDGADNTKEER